MIFWPRAALSKMSLNAFGLSTMTGRPGFGFSLGGGVFLMMMLGMVVLVFPDVVMLYHLFLVAMYASVMHIMASAMSHDTSSLVNTMTFLRGYGVAGYR